jgi:hypothetical protein
MTFQSQFEEQPTVMVGCSSFYSAARDHGRGRDAGGRNMQVACFL